jgi:branched-chain amino acid transport system permease protein
MASFRMALRAGPAGLNEFLSRPRALAPIFLVAIPLPFVLQYFVDDYGWTGGEYWLRIATIAALWAGLTLALNLMVGYAGLFNVGFIAFYGIGSYSYAIVASDQVHVHLPVWWAAVVVLLASLAFALGLGLPALRLRGDYLAIVTLSFAIIVQELVLDLDRPPTILGHQFGPDDFNLTNGSQGINLVDRLSLPDSWPVVHGLAVQTRSYYWIALALAALFAFLSHRWRQSRVGRAWVAIREDEIAARAMGVNTYKYKVLAFCAGSVMAAVTGMVSGAWTANADPANFDLAQALLPFMMLFLGGIGSIPGAIVGACIVTVLPFALQPLVYYKWVIFSLVLIVLIVFRPQGLMGAVLMKPRGRLGGTVELLTEEIEAAPADAALVEAATGAIIPEARKSP